MKIDLLNFIGVAVALLIGTPIKADGNAVQGSVEVRVQRLLGKPIISPQLDPSIGPNIQGPSLIRVPEWIEEPLGKYYLYFADHKGSYIRLAYADALTGPWKIHAPGTLQLYQTGFPQQPQDLSPAQLNALKEKFRAMGVDVDSFPHDPLKELTTPHIASPDVHVDHDNRRILMYYHGLKAPGQQVTRVAVSNDGISFTSRDEDLGKTYMRTFAHREQTFALAMPGQIYRSEDGIRNFESGPRLFNKDMRHAGLLKRNNTLYVFWTQVGHVPERILLSYIDISGPWTGWQESEPVEVLRPGSSWEGADAPLEPSIRSVAYGHVNQLRDPYVFEEDGRTYLLYTVAGESGIGIAAVQLPNSVSEDGIPP
ncbi:hypothetical protein SAMN04487965_0279 [Microbulbifer donghaiensis]|uniref:Glycosyl hydrolases family 43 n=1 Tax=Microbulbifer donghaiensis TaxID=494016 RepID=A0A1M4UYH6_9GAMM|nr:hypothetical protein [Microbulbifer donghaiensis]SHE61722.1 hypothetical protein SAMN04487965_0279 [Microbulbifer donghaiensis]